MTVSVSKQSKRKTKMNKCNGSNELKSFEKKITTIIAKKKTNHMPRMWKQWANTEMRIIITKTTAQEHASAKHKTAAHKHIRNHTYMQSVHHWYTEPMGPEPAWWKERPSLVNQQYSSCLHLKTSTESRKKPENNTPNCCCNVVESLRLAKYSFESVRSW